MAPIGLSTALQGRGERCHNIQGYGEETGHRNHADDFIL